METEYQIKTVRSLQLDLLEFFFRPLPAPSLPFSSVTTIYQLFNLKNVWLRLLSSSFTLHGK